MKSTTPIARVAFGFEEMDAAGLCTEADGTIAGLTGNTYITTPPQVALGPVTTAGTVAFQAAAVRAALAQQAAGNKSESLTKQVGLAASLLMQYLKSNGYWVQGQANSLAAGNLDLAKKIILSTGYKLEKEHDLHPRTFEVVATGPGWAHYHTGKTVKGTEGQLWRYALTTAKNVPPPAGALITRFTHVTDIIISDLPSGSIIAMQHASTASDDTAENNAAGAITKANHPIFSHNTLDPYAWSDFIYEVIP
jgi:hypothetical protein